MPSHIEFAYSLTEEEVFDGLRLSGTYKTSGKRALIETLILCVFCGFFLFSYFTKQDTFSLVMSLVCIVVVLALNFIPRMDMHKQSRKGEKNVKIRLYQDKICVDTAAGTQTILLDGTSVIQTVGQTRNLITVRIARGGLLVIPIRAIPMEVRGQAMSLLLKNG